MERRTRRLARRAARKQFAAALVELEQLRKLKPVAVYAIRYVGAIDAPNLAETWDIAKKRDDLVAVVHSVQGRPEKSKKDPQVLELRPVQEKTRPEGGFQTSRFPTQPLPRKQSSTAPARDREQLLRDLEVKRREHHNAAAAYGAEVNKHHRDHSRAAELARALDVAAKALAAAELSVKGAAA